MSTRTKPERDGSDPNSSQSRFVTGQAYSPRSVLLTLSLAILTLAVVTYSSFDSFRALHELDRSTTKSSATALPKNGAEVLSRCQALRTKAGPSPDFREREASDRFDPQMNHNTSYLIKNATILTGEKNGTNVVHGDLLLVNGIVKGLGKNVPRDLVENLSDSGEEKKNNLTVIEAEGRWVTPGLIDIHSHLGLFSVPAASGAYELDSHKGPILPWLRSIDGFHTYDEGIELAIAGGVTSVQVLAGSANPIGGQAYVVKLRKTSEGSPSSMIVEPPGKKHHWRHLMRVFIFQQSCSEKTRRYGNRMDGAWALRSAYYEAKSVMKLQDSLCTRAESGLWDPEERSGEAVFPEKYQWEMLVEVLRGNVKVTNDCYETVDLDRMVRLSNEFDFPLDTILHGSDAWLVPGLLNKTAYGPPAVAMLATNHHFSHESLRGSEFAPRVLSEQNISVVMTVSGPLTERSSRQLLFEAQKAYHYGLSSDLAVASITSVPAEALGLSHRLGILHEGSDADIVLWDSHPLQIGATPVHVWIDGIMQIPLPGQGNVTAGTKKEEKWKVAPEQPNYDVQRELAVKREGQPPLRGKVIGSKIAFLNVSEVWTMKGDGSIEEIFPQTGGARGTAATVIVEDGKVTCVGAGDNCRTDSLPSINLEGGSISPGLMTYGSLLGIEELETESSTQDGRLYNAFVSDVPAVLRDVGGATRAVDALMFGTRHVHKAYRNGVTTATSSLARPFNLQGSSSMVIWGLSVCFSTGAKHAFERDAIIQDEAALHVRIARSYFNAEGKAVTVSAQIAGLRRLLHGWESTDTNTGSWFRNAAEGVIPLVVDVHSADIMASLLLLKAEVDDRIGGQMRMVFAGATEAHIVAKEIGEARVGVILTSLQPYPTTWDQRRILAGPPITNDTNLSVLLRHGVSVGLGTEQPQLVGDTRFLLSQASALLDAQDRLDRKHVYELGSTNLQRLLGITRMESESTVLIASEGGSLFDMSSKIIAAISPQQSGVEIF
ncbi:composite domain of metallo-dependent hydrolase [Dendrothele bispora CBS 962.96]|uniref:Composite domain of metallo-dependent hydrolase n=1 Tax=Dendrothele bispora (strain CBS 962.96) TaxID=1314807 RepID=A0A4S8MZ18_DENBC|nr:composite domain of metallo-dependent hydrolase [Dendrothele bispora CBS 962.96]